MPRKEKTINVKRSAKKQKKVVGRNLDKKKVAGRKLKSELKPATSAMTATPQVEVFGKLFKYNKEASSAAGNNKVGGLNMSNFNRIRPRIDFWKREEYYLSVGRVQNVVESFVLNLINREWYYDAGNDDSELNDTAVKGMEEWEEQVNISKLIAAMVRNWLINGVHIISPKDWIPVQLQTIAAKKRDKEGNTEFYYQVINGQERPLPAKDFLEIPYIEFDREPWPVGQFDSLMNKDWLDIDGRDPRSSLELYRQALQDNMKIHHKYASPRVIYTAEGVSKTTLDNDIIPIIEGMGNGDRAAFNAIIDIKQETVDGNARFIEHVNKIIDEIDTGLQSSSNRLITEPSAMADAREAGAQDDDRTLGIMERVRIFMNKEVIPRVTGLPAGEVVFKWGSKDAFDLEFPEPIKLALETRLIHPEQALIMLMEQWHWKIPSLEDALKKLGANTMPETQEEIQEKQMKQDQQKDETQKVAKKAAEMAVEQVTAKFESAPQTELEQKQIENIKLENKLKNEKIVFMDKLNRELEGTK